MKWPWVSRRRYDQANTLRHEYADKLLNTRNMLTRLHDMINRGEKPVRNFTREIEAVLKAAK